LPETGPVANRAARGGPDIEGEVAVPVVVEPKRAKTGRARPARDIARDEQRAGNRSARALEGDVIDVHDDVIDVSNDTLSVDRDVLSVDDDVLSVD
jgi:hypothetical protein